MLEVKTIPLNEGELRRELLFPGGPEVWNLHKYGGLIRHLDEFETHFVEAAMKAQKEVIAKHYDSTPHTEFFGATIAEDIRE